MIIDYENRPLSDLKKNEKDLMTKKADQEKTYLDQDWENSSLRRKKEGKKSIVYRHAEIDLLFCAAAAAPDKSFPPAGF